MSSGTAPSPDSSTPSTPSPEKSSSPPPPPSPAAPSPKESPPPPSSPSPKKSPPPPSTPKESPSSSPPPPSTPKESPSRPSSSPDASPSPPSKDSSPPPPPPPHSKSASHPPPPHKLSPPSDSSGSSNNQKTIVIAAAAAGGILVLALIIICAICIKKNKKRKHSHTRMQYYTDPAHKGNEYYQNSNQPNWRHNNSLGMDNARLSPPPAVGPWSASPPPHMMQSSGDSSNFSGPHRQPLPPPSPNLSLGFNKSTFSYEELAAATNGFSQENLLGQGGFGYVHKGVLPNGKEVAVKSLKMGSGQGEREFQAEVEIISRVHHRHLVSLVGYCIAGGQRMLVYEFVENKTLEYHLHGKGLPTMDMATRLRIAVGSAKGLAYLHEDCHPRIIHRDIKAANILLDNNFEAMVADFGLAKLSSDNHTHVSTRVMGTFGYLAPEYASSGKLTEKSDVFSFGIMLLELITGRRPVDPSSGMEDSLVDWARPLTARALEEGKYDGLVDIRLENNYNPNEMARLVASAAASIRHSAKRRPKMSQIVRALEGDVSLDDLNEGVRPGQSAAFSPRAESSDYDASSYHSDMKKIRKMALSGQEEIGNSTDSSVDSPHQK